jgi:hypothetical protein
LTDVKPWPAIAVIDRIETATANLKQPENLGVAQASSEKAGSK